MLVVSKIFFVIVLSRKCLYCNCSLNIVVDIKSYMADIKKKKLYFASFC